MQLSLAQMLNMAPIRGKMNTEISGNPPVNDFRSSAISFLA